MIARERWLKGTLYFLGVALILAMVWHYYSVWTTHARGLALYRLVMAGRLHITSRDDLDYLVNARLQLDRALVISIVGVLSGLVMIVGASTRTLLQSMNLMITKLEKPSLMRTGVLTLLALGGTYAIYLGLSNLVASHQRQVVLQQKQGEYANCERIVGKEYALRACGKPPN